MPISNELKEVYVNANVNIALVETVELVHPSFTQNWYLCKSNLSFEGQIEDTSLVTYQPYGFDFKLPDETTKGQSNAQFIVDATTNEALNDFLNFIDNPTTPIKLNYRRYLSNSTEIQQSVLGIELLEIELNYNRIQGAASRPDIVNRKFPLKRYDATEYKGLNYV